MEELLATLPKGLSVVDVPFGTGRFVPDYLENGYSIHGLDVSDEMLKAAENALGDSFANCTVATGSAMDLPYKDGEFDLLVSTRFLRDIIVARDAQKALSEFARVTKKYAVIQLGENTTEAGEAVDPNFVLGSRLSAAGNTTLLAEVGLKIVEKRLVMSDPDNNSTIYHFLCEKG